MKTIKSINPYTLDTLATFKQESDQLVSKRIQQSKKAFLKWNNYDIEQRATFINKCADILLTKKAYFAKLITLEMGKILTEAIAEVEKCALVCQYYAEHAKKFLADQPLKVNQGNAFIHYNPLGTVLAIMPWNFPFWQVFRCAAPTLMAGNTILLKHASNVPQCAKAIEEIFNEAGLPEGSFITLFIDKSQIEQIIAHDNVQAVTLTGSEQAGSEIAKLAGKHIKKTVLELGGSDPFIVLEDADVQKAAHWAIKSRMQNCGQSCIAAKRFIILNNIVNTFTSYLKEELSKINIGNPLKENTQCGPMARVDLVEEIHKQVQKSVELGAQIIIGGKRPNIQGAFFEPTLLINVKSPMPAFDEELFGPVAALTVVHNEKEAINLANASRFGLGASIWSNDINKAKEIAKKINSGAVYINKMMASDPQVPFGGVKKSGYGRELSHLGIREFTNHKTIWIT